MRVILKSKTLVLSPETEAETRDFQSWLERHRDHVFHLASGSERGGALHDMGVKADACREPINIVLAAGDARWRPISNLALTPFELDGRRYASVEGFWQGLKTESAPERKRIAALWGAEAKRAISGAAPSTFVYDGRTHTTGTHEHWGLMHRACTAKFTHNNEARTALLATGDRPLVHRVRRDSTIIPGALMADIWMRVRATLKTPPTTK
jgi:predicted NAD-dependent protein-ADP-ribosyltransferase YbiA (DUF1768 family)